MVAYKETYMSLSLYTE